jgi:hypothetical protein
MGLRLPLDPLPPLFSRSCTSSPESRATTPGRLDESDPLTPLGVMTEAEDSVALLCSVELVDGE